MDDDQSSDEITVEGFTVEDFFLLKTILEHYPITVLDKNYSKIKKLYEKIRKTSSFLKTE